MEYIVIQYILLILYFMKHRMARVNTLVKEFSEKYEMLILFYLTIAFTRRVVFNVPFVLVAYKFFLHFYRENVSRVVEKHKTCVFLFFKMIFLLLIQFRFDRYVSWSLDVNGLRQKGDRWITTFTCCRFSFNYKKGIAKFLLFLNI